MVYIDIMNIEEYIERVKIYYYLNTLTYYIN